MLRGTSRPRWLRTLAVCSSVILLVFAAPVAADEPVPPSAVEAPAAPATPAVSETQRSRRLREIDRQLARDKKRITELLSQPAAPETTPLRLDPELREIAERMPQLQAERRLWVKDPKAAAAAESASGAP